MKQLISIREAKKRYPNGTDVIHALDGVDFDLHEGELVAITGRSGSGKSTLLKVCAGIEVVDGGTVTVAGTQLEKATPATLAATRRHHIGVVFQQLNLLPSLTALENVALPLELDGVSVSEANAQAQIALNRVELGDRGGQFPDQLSGGQRQRIAIARGIVGTRKILLADEPTGALDQRSGAQILGLLRAQADAGAGVVMVTHDRALAGLADRVVELRDGVISSVVSRPDVETELSELWG